MFALFLLFAHQVEAQTARAVARLYPLDKNNVRGIVTLESTGSGTTSVNVNVTGQNRKDIKFFNLTKFILQIKSSFVD